MKQTRLMSFLESAINIVVGFGISLGAQMIFLPMLGVAISHTQNFAFACIMTVVSLGRQFGLRRLFEKLHIRRPLSPFMQAVVAERLRHVEVEGWSHDHDDQHRPGELATSGAVYALHAFDPPLAAPLQWLWSKRWWKPAPHDPRRNLVKAASLVIAEGEKFDRSKHLPAEARQPKPTPRFTGDQAIEEFVAGATQKDSRGKVSAGHLYDTYDRWCQARGYSSVNAKAFGVALSERGFERIKGRTVQWGGLVLKESA